MKISFLGPTSSFCHQATEDIVKKLELNNSEIEETKSIYDVFNKVENSLTDIGIIPLENALEGSVPITLQCLAYEYEVDIIGEYDLPISLHLCASTEIDLKDIKIIYSHPHALAQSAHWIHNNMPWVETVETNSTSAAAKKVLSEKNAGAICSEKSKEYFKLTKLVENVQQNDNNETRFILIKQKNSQLDIKIDSQINKTSIVCFQKENRPGSLFDILGLFNKFNVDLTKLESRPTKEGLGSYCFFIDFMGNINDLEVKNTLNELNRISNIKILGSYPVIF